MLSNLHTHSKFCDGANTLEEMVLSAIDKGFCSLGFSGHGYTDFDLTYCMKDTAGYAAEIKRLREKYKKDIEIYLGVEEDMYCFVNRSDFDYIIGSSHYIHMNDTYYPVDSNYKVFDKCLELFDRDPIKIAHAYYKPFCEYIRSRKPDVVGHFDLITKFDELHDHIFLGNEKYLEVAGEYIKYAAESGCIFELNTGAISRGVRKTFYLQEKLLGILKDCGTRITVTSDSHKTDTLDFKFDEAKKYLKDIGFDSVYVLYGGEFKKTLI